MKFVISCCVDSLQHLYKFTKEIAMKTNQIFILSAIMITTAFFGVLSVFELPHTVMEWVVSDTILGVILYFNYLVIAMNQNSTKTRTRFQS